MARLITCDPVFQEPDGGSLVDEHEGGKDMDIKQDDPKKVCSTRLKTGGERMTNVLLGGFSRKQLMGKLCLAFTAS